MWFFFKFLELSGLVEFVPQCLGGSGIYPRGNDNNGENQNDENEKFQI